MGNVYIIKSNTHFKIGVSNDPLKRLKELATGNPLQLTLHDMFAPRDISAYELEGKLHKLFDKYRAQGEWFEIECIDHVNEVIHKIHKKGGYRAVYDKPLVGEQLSLSIGKKYRHDLPSFAMIGTTDRKTRMSSFDLPAVLQDLSKPATWLFWELVRNRNNINEAKFLPKDKAQANSMSKAYKELHRAGCAKRIKRGEYLINPKAYLPIPELFEQVWDKWESIK